MKIDSLFLPIKLSKYIPIISTCSTKSPNSTDMARNTLKDLHYMVDANILLKSMPSI